VQTKSNKTDTYETREGICGKYRGEGRKESEKEGEKKKVREKE
jgi:hypothetical protein